MKPFNLLCSMLILILLAFWITPLSAQATSDPVYHQVTMKTNQTVTVMPIDYQNTDLHIGYWQIGERSWPVYQGTYGGWYIVRIPIDKTTNQPDRTRDTYKQYVKPEQKQKVVLKL